MVFVYLLRLRLIPRACKDVLLPRFRCIFEQRLPRILVSHIAALNLLHDVLLVGRALRKRRDRRNMRSSWIPRLARGCESNGRMSCGKGTRCCAFAALVLAGHAKRIHVHSEVRIVVEMPLFGCFAEDRERTSCGERGVEEDGRLAVCRASKDLVEFGMPIDCDER